MAKADNKVRMNISLTFAAL